MFARVALGLLFRRRSIPLTVGLAFLLAACAEPPTDVEDRAEFRQQLVHDQAIVTEFLQKTEAGVNLSDFALGWFVDSFLIEIAAHDDGLSRRFYKGGQFMDTYLTETFQNHPAEEIAAIERMAERRNTTLRMAARYALEVLRHIPNTKAPPQEQARDRRDLANALRALKRFEDRALAEDIGTN